jgi:hypothetical protein
VDRSRLASRHEHDGLRRPAAASRSDALLSARSGSLVQSADVRAEARKRVSGSGVCVRDADRCCYVKSRRTLSMISVRCAWRFRDSRSASARNSVVAIVHPTEMLSISVSTCSGVSRLLMRPRF